MDVLSRTRFHLARCYGEAPFSFFATGLGTFTIVIALVGVALENKTVNRLSEELSRAGQLPANSVPAASLPTAKVALIPFAGASLVKGINTVAQDMGIPFDEASYVLDNLAAVPYKKYRVTLKTTAGYAEIRRFIPALSADLPHLGLDSIHCTRRDLAASALSCELAFSAFYSKTPNE